MINEQEASAIVSRLAIAYPVTEGDVSIYLTITGDERRTEEACKAAALGCHHPPIKDALMYSEATTADGIRLWIQTVRRRGNL